MNVIEDAGDPLLAVPVRVAVVLRVGPMVLLELLLPLLVLLLPPHAASPNTNARTLRAITVFHRNSLR